MVAVVDTGVGTRIPALSGRVTTIGEAGKDCVGHGSFVAGLVAAAPQTDAGFTGIAPEARILAVRGTDERGVATATTVAHGIRAAVDGGAGAISVSLALPSRNKDLSAAVRYAVDHDTVVVAAAAPDTQPRGLSSGQQPPSAYWPAAEPGVLSVVDFGADGGRPNGVPAPQADLAAPGSGVVSVGPSGSGAFAGSGSSLAAGVVAGVAALVRSYHPKMTAPQVVQQLMATAYSAQVPKVDPYGAVSGTLTGMRPTVSQRPVAVKMPEAAKDGGAVARGTWVALGSALVALIVILGAYIVPRGRERGWRAE
ncbi:S8 family serine peptidase [Streptomyces sp. NPDC056707]|uniref:S8 family serine peptidase n=1 Tax=Streptomyces sp. NPDC056707 TaxID=3345919 RepID=UPI0036761846